MRSDIVMFLGLVAVIGGGIIAAVFFLFGGGDGGSNICDKPLVPLGESEISQLAFQTEDVGLTRVIEAATVGNLQAAEEAFFGDVHNFTHNVDPPLREVDEELAKELCEAVVRIEEELAFERRADRVAIEATRIRDLLRDAAEALDYARPGDEGPLGAEPRRAILHPYLESRDAEKGGRFAVRSPPAPRRAVRHT